MTFREAKDKLKELAGGRYHRLSYELTEHSSGKLEAECRLYIDPKISSGYQSTWEEAFAELQKVMNPLKRDHIDLTEAPE